MNIFAIPIRKEEGLIRFSKNQMPLAADARRAIRTILFSLSCDSVNLALPLNCYDYPVRNTDNAIALFADTASFYA